MKIDTCSFPTGRWTGMVLLMIGLLLSADFAQAQYQADPLTRQQAEDIVNSRSPRSANPYTAYLPAGVEGDYEWWNAYLQIRAAERNRAMSTAAPKTSVVGIPESEGNNTSGTADPLPGWGLGLDPAASITGTLTPGDVDFFTFTLAEGDIIGACVDPDNTSAVAIAGSVLEVLAPDGATILHGSAQDASGLYGTGSPMPGGCDGGNTVAVVAFVAPTAGTYFLRHFNFLSNAEPAYEIDLQIFRREQAGACNQANIYLDFDGATVNAPALFGSGNNPAVLSPLSTFLGNWGLVAGDLNAVIDEILAYAQENAISDMVGENPGFIMGIFNSRDHGEIGAVAAPVTSRHVIGGTIAELGINTIGIASSIDPGNFQLDETTVTLLDLLSAAAANPNSLNQYGLAGGATMVDLIGAGVGNIASHEYSHTAGNYHTDQFNGTPNIIDQGGNLDNTVGVGPNNNYETLTAGTPGGDDVDVDNVTDTYVGSEGYMGSEDSQARSAWGSPFGANTACTQLPVELASFEALINGRDVTLKWTTINESNNSGFVVQRQIDSGFEDLGFVDGHGTTLLARNYTFEVRNLEPGLHRFRLKQIDFDGTYEFSQLVEALIEVPGTFVMSDAYPNPFNPQAQFTLAVSREQQVRVDLFDVTGRLVRTLYSGQLSANTSHRFIIDGSGLTSGTYIYRAVGETFQSKAHSVTLLK